MKSILNLSFLVILTLPLLSHQTKRTTSNPFLKIKLSELPQLIEGHWEYDYSFNEDGAFEIDGEYMQDHYVPFHIEFNKISKKKNKQIINLYPDIAEKRVLNCLKEFEFSVDYKGVIRYPILRSDKTDANGYLNNCKIKLFTPRHPDQPDYITINSVSKNTMIVSNYQNDQRNDFHLFVKSGTGD